jgi:hypothetical protein
VWDIIPTINWLYTHGIKDMLLKTVWTPQELNEFARHLTEKGMTYILGVGHEYNEYLVLDEQYDITNEDRFIYAIHFTLEPGSTHYELKVGVPFISDSGFGTGPHPGVRLGEVKAYLFDYSQEKYRDISSFIKSTDASFPYEVSDEATIDIIVSFDEYSFVPGSELVIVAKMRTNLLRSSGSDMPIFWKEKTKKILGDIWKGYTTAVSKDGLRGILFLGEVNAPLGQRYFRSEGDEEGLIYADLGGDRFAIREYRRWLQREYGTITKLNKYLKKDYSSFEEVEWVLPLRPNNAEDHPQRDILFGLFNSLEQEEKIAGLQREFFLYFLGKTAGEFSEMVKGIFGDVPTIIGSYAAYNLIFPESALKHGVDVLGISYFGDFEGDWPGNFDTRKDFSNALNVLHRIQKESGKTKGYVANELTILTRDFYRPFESQDEIRRFFSKLAEVGVKGFVYLNEYEYGWYERHPEIDIQSHSEERFKWFAELREDIIQAAIEQQNIPFKDIR